ncbi:glycosyltransferase [Piscinibacter koreensis]|uniref:Glycosyltransferase n=1 Tax=Piscinibacter koreensis TaxID=2742824 RepID=A0A7Y6TXD7_9BURK|nr:glycosyltransferase [Schlegelella koreensis]NUZ06992.1 glycosyltransferase [Schlegelella koreensis]
MTRRDATTPAGSDAATPPAGADREPAAPPAGTQPRVALIDGGSFVLPYDHRVATALAGQGVGVDFHGSRTAYNAEFLDAIAALPGARVTSRRVSGTTASRLRGGVEYARLWLGVWRARRRYGAVNLQFSVLWPVELPFCGALGRRFVLTVHNPVPHGFAGQRHRPTAWLARLAARLVFVSTFSRNDFIARYGERFRAKSVVLPHDLLPLAPGLPRVPYVRWRAPEALVFWSTVKPYKGVDLFADLARSRTLRASSLGLEVVGAWDAALAPLRTELAGLGVTVVDRFLDGAELLALLARPVVFVLPYREASQSGALYTLLHHGCLFMCSDVGDLGDFMRRNGLESMLLADRSAAAVEACLARLAADPAAVLAAFAGAQAATAAAATAAMPLRAAYGLAA